MSVNHMVKRGFWFTLLYAASLTALPARAHAQDYPVRPITLILGLQAGGAVDIVSRMFADKASRHLGQPVVFENRSGGGGIVAALAVKQARPDGYTLMVVLGALHSITPAIQSVPFDPIDDFDFITPLYTIPLYFVVPKSSPVSSMKELAAYGKNKPGGLSYGSASPGSPGHVMGALFQEATKVPMVHVAYRGGGQLMTDLIGGQLDLAVVSYTNIKGHLEEGRVKALGIGQSTRWSGTPNVATFSEQGFPEVEGNPLFGIAGPKGLPPDVVKKLNETFVAVSRDPELVRKFDELGVNVNISTPSELKRLIVEDAAKVGPVVKKLDVKM